MTKLLDKQATSLFHFVMRYSQQNFDFEFVRDNIISNQNMIEVLPKSGEGTEVTHHSHPETMNGQ